MLRDDEAVEWPLARDWAIMSMHKIVDDDLKRQKRQRLIVDEIESDHNELCIPPIGHKYIDWTPLKDRSGLFPESLDTSDPWQLRNTRVT